jgi:hypothetical protein
VKNLSFLRPVRKSTMARRTGNRRQAVSEMKPIATATMISAIGVISNRVKGSSPWLRATPSTSRLVEVPISVHMPPRMAV